jgi:phage FluMu gp28-like protein
MLSSWTARLFGGVDVGRHRHWTVITVVERSGLSCLARAILRIEGTRLPEQQQRLEEILALPNLRLLKMDMTGLGLGLFEYTQEKFPCKVQGVNFSTSVPACSLPFGSGQLQNPRSPIQNQNVRVTERLATRLLQTYEDRAIQHPIDSILREDLRKPERLVGPTGRVSIAATADGAGHADHFWSLALAIDAAISGENAPTFVKVIQRWKRPLFETRRRGLTM